MECPSRSERFKRETTVRHGCRLHDYTARRSGHERSSSDEPCFTGKIGPPADKNDVYDWPVTLIIPDNLALRFLKTNQSPAFRRSPDARAFAADGLLQDFILRNRYTGYKKSDVRTQKEKIGTRNENVVIRTSWMSLGNRFQCPSSLQGAC